MNSQAFKYIIITPKNATHIKYSFDQNKDKMSIKINKFQEYLINISIFLPPKELTFMNELLWEFQPFIIDVENKKILQLEIDLDSLKKEGYLSRRENLYDEKQALKQVKNQKEENKKEYWKNDKIYEKFGRKI